MRLLCGWLTLPSHAELWELQVQREEDCSVLLFFPHSYIWIEVSRNCQKQGLSNEEMKGQRSQKTSQTNTSRSKNNRESERKSPNISNLSMCEHRLPWATQRPGRTFHSPAGGAGCEDDWGRRRPGDEMQKETQQRKKERKKARLWNVEV